MNKINLPTTISQWKIQQLIKTGKIQYLEGDQVILIKRKENGYPKSINDDEDWFIRKIDREFLVIHKHSTDGIGWLQPRRIHRTYFLPLSYIRDIKLNSLFNE